MEHCNWQCGFKSEYGCLLAECAYHRELPKTKADRIRSKTNEELAEFLFHVFHSPIKPLSKEELLEALQEPAEEE